MSLQKSGVLQDWNRTTNTFDKCGEIMSTEIGKDTNLGQSRVLEMTAMFEKLSLGEEQARRSLVEDTKKTNANLVRDPEKAKQKMKICNAKKYGLPERYQEKNIANEKPKQIEQTVAEHKNRGLEETKKVNAKLVNDLKKAKEDLKTCNSEKCELQERVEDCRRSLEETKKANAELVTVLEKTNEDFKSCNAEKCELQKRLSDNEIALKGKDKIIEDLNTGFNHLEELNRRSELSKPKIEQAMNQLKTNAKNKSLELNSIIDERDNFIKTLKTEKDDLQTRLSSFAGNKLTRGNPSITDLNNPNRPMKIGERYGELYDNDWTDAMEKVDSVIKHFPDKNESEIEEIVIHYLHRIVRCCYRGCLDMANRQVIQVIDIIGLNQCKNVENININEDVPGLKELMACRRKKAVHFTKQLALKKAFCDTLLDEWDYPFKNEAAMKEFISSPFYEKCVELCWHMVIQDPVMCLDDDLPPGTEMDKNTYREFTKSGETVVYVVWPALYLHKNGPVLYKGVAHVK